MKKTLTLKPSYVTTNTVRFDETNLTVTEPAHDPSDWLAKREAAKPQGVLGTPVTEYLQKETLAAMGWKPEDIGPEYTVDARGKSFVRQDVIGPSLKVTYEIA